jgi:hypothetical protein
MSISKKTSNKKLTSLNLVNLIIPNKKFSFCSIQRKCTLDGKLWNFYVFMTKRDESEIVK